jgi:hypothetical protein
MGLDHPRYGHVERGRHQQCIKFLSAIRSGKHAAPTTSTTSAEEAAEWYCQSAVQECGFLEAGRALQELLRATCVTTSAAAASVWHACCGRGLWVLGFGGNVTPEASAINDTVVLLQWDILSALHPRSVHEAGIDAPASLEKEHRRRWARAKGGESDHQHVNHMVSPAVTRPDVYEVQHQMPHE